jgi:site-specific DNA-methyltransferase (adenine-specific)
MILADNLAALTIHGDCLDEMKTLPDHSVDAIVTDPPAGIGFMGKKWDLGRGGRDNWISWMCQVASECYRVLKHGGHAVVWALPRNSHWTATAWENAGFEVRDRIAHAFSTGFPKSHSIQKAIEKKQGEGAAQEFVGWGTALKPAIEDWWLLRKPIESGLTVAENMLKWGVGGINIDACRVEGSWNGSPTRKQGKKNDVFGKIAVGLETKQEEGGRFPSNFTHDNSEDVAMLLSQDQRKFFKSLEDTQEDRGHIEYITSILYVPKASTGDKELGCGDIEPRIGGSMSGKETRDGKPTNHPLRQNSHPTVKSTALMRYLCRLVTPPQGIVLDPFMGSGSTGVACMREGFRFIGIEQDEHYYSIASSRINHSKNMYLEEKGIATWP